MDDKEFKRDWIRQCMFEYIGLHLEGMGGYFHQCWEEARRALGDVPEYDEWFEGCRIAGTVCDMIGEWWYESFRGKEKEFKEFMEEIGFSDYVERFKEEFEVEVVWVSHQGSSCYYLRDRLDIVIRML